MTSTPMLGVDPPGVVCYSHDPLPVWSASRGPDTLPGRRAGLYLSFGLLSPDVIHPDGCKLLQPSVARVVQQCMTYPQ